ncbi:hypothetical protein SBF1_5930002 [Candidatus Desulfosporosinus infrequens]|uniref:Uncharacterized protein n=1 Tax=Candidatus Desulfosporosinus infrequens TaxID=2043169 RepID=A0A2U3LKY7_9FIRM|nr:hypothetical protein SBF1_5930002 [Candidatus Desulfosporosinus infrequens]
MLATYPPDLDRVERLTRWRRITEAVGICYKSSRVMKITIGLIHYEHIVLLFTEFEHNANL